MSNAKYHKFATGDVVLLALIGSCTHYQDHGVMLLNPKGEKLVWLPEPDNEAAKRMRDEVVVKLLA